MTPAEQLARVRRRRSLPHTREPGPLECLVRAKRHSLGLTMLEVADHVGVAESHLCDIERGIDLKMSTAARLAKFFGVAVHELWPTAWR